jgi:[histone H3]-dimethyl-L-lysine9 demethylase
MYNSMFSYQTPGSKGTTRLHMDRTDTLNVMTYASPAPDGSPGGAAWDLFRAEDSDKLRQFLRKRFQGTFQHDPIHSQQFYLDSATRKELHDSYGIKCHRVYQRPGEAVLIPAGCAHQVRAWFSKSNYMKVIHNLGCRCRICRIVSKLRWTLSAPNMLHDARD